jgi:hypothetical protein
MHLPCEVFFSESRAAMTSYQDSNKNQYIRDEFYLKFTPSLLLKEEGDTDSVTTRRVEKGILSKLQD